MAIGNIVCRSGVGPNATIPLFVTHGLGLSEPPPPSGSIDGGWITRHVEGYKKRKRRLEEQVEEKRDLLAQIQAAMEPKLLEEQTLQKRSIRRAQFYQSIETQAYIKQINLLNMQLQELALEMQKLELLSRRLPDDEEAFLLLIA